MGVYAYPINLVTVILSHLNIHVVEVRLSVLPLDIQMLLRFAFAGILCLLRDNSVSLS